MTQPLIDWPEAGGPTPPPTHLASDVRKMARATDPDTSHEAAQDAAGNSDKHRALALRLLEEAGPDGLTDFDLAAATGIQQTSIGKRRGELRDAGLVINSGRKRPSPSGSAAIVWVAVEKPVTKEVG
jgi:hypothetical protein